MKKALAALFALMMLASFTLVACGDSSTGASSSAPAASSSSAASSSASTADEHEDVTMMVAAAASLEYSFTDELIPMFQELYPWVTVEGSYDASGKLQTQIEEGLAADVFMSAAMKQMTALEEGGFIDPASVVELLENEIVLITGTDTETTVTSFEDIDNAATIALGDPESVPVGQYSEEALTSLGLFETIQPKVSMGTNVTEVLNWVAEGSAEVGIVYATDAATMPDKVKVIATAPEGSLETKVIYPVGVLAEAPQKEAAELFIEFLQTPEAIAVFEAYGFKSNI